MLNRVAQRFRPRDLLRGGRDDRRHREDRFLSIAQISNISSRDWRVPIGECLVAICAVHHIGFGDLQGGGQHNSLQRDGTRGYAPLGEREIANTGDPLRDGELFQSVDHHKVAGDGGEQRMLRQNDLRRLAEILKGMPAESRNGVVDHDLGREFIPAVLDPGRNGIRCGVHLIIHCISCHLAVSALDGFHGGGIIAVPILISKGNGTSA